MKIVLQGQMCYVYLHRVKDLEEVTHTSEVGIHVELRLVKAESSHALFVVLDMLGHL
jgi:hypothetical protein